MKKRLTAFIFVLALLLAALPATVWAASGTASLTGPGTVRAGDTITLTFSVGGSHVEGVSGTLQYDSAQLTKTDQRQTIASPWMVEFNGNSMIAYDNDLSTPIDSARGLFTVSFQVGNLKPGTQITVSYGNVIASDGSSDANIGTVSYRVTVAEPLSDNNALSALTVSNATISPAFSAGTTAYTADVPYSVSKLDVKATAADGKAQVSIDNPTLTSNAVTTVTITVTAENGARKTYTIKVHRAKDPNYVASGNNNLSGITVEGFLLSPVFDPERTEYVVWLPYETERVTVTGTAADGKASVTVTGGEALEAGKDNPVQVICTAENGEQRIYTVVVKRAPAHDSEATEPTDPSEEVTEPTEPSTEPTELTEPSEAPRETTEPAATISAAETGGLGHWWWLFVLIALLCLGAGFCIGYFVKKGDKKAAE